MRLRIIAMTGLMIGAGVLLSGGRLGLPFLIVATQAQNAAPTHPSPTVSVPLAVDGSRPAPAQPEVGLSSDRHLDKTPPRATKGLDLVKMNWTYNCMECHRSLEVKWHRDRTPVEHQSIVLNHGNNRFCLNCHNAKNLNTFVDYDGSEIAEQDVVLLCAKCHGTTYRDWKAGAHGRRNGFWKVSEGPQTRLRCIQCHDPHHPKFKAMEALPAPHYPTRAAGSAQPHARPEQEH